MIGDYFVGVFNCVEKLDCGARRFAFQIVENGIDIFVRCRSPDNELTHLTSCLRFAAQ